MCFSIPVFVVLYGDVCGWLHVKHLVLHGLYRVILHPCNKKPDEENFDSMQQTVKARNSGQEGVQVCLNSPVHVFCHVVTSEVFWRMAIIVTVWCCINWVFFFACAGASCAPQRSSCICGVGLALP